MSVGNLKDQGNKGNNLPFQMKNLMVLARIAASVAPPGGLASEVTLQAVLAALQNGQDFEEILVKDDGDVGYPNSPLYSQVRIWDPDTQTFEAPTYYNADGSAHVLLGNPVYQDVMSLLAPVQVTPGLVVTNAAGTVAAGKKSVTIFNSGGADGTVLGQVFKKGLIITWTGGGINNTVDAIIYDASGTEFTITTTE